MFEEVDEHKAGYVALIGKPNAGKSTLLNSLLREKLVITSPKAQTTRHRIVGLYNDENTQIVFSDTPGIITPEYTLHKKMMSAVEDTLRDSDIILWIADVNDDLSTIKDEIAEFISEIKVPVFFVMNKVETPKKKKRAIYWKEVYRKVFPENRMLTISAREQLGVDDLIDTLKKMLPLHPPYYDKEQLAISQTRFFVSELIRETIFEDFDQEIPYQTAVNIVSYKEKKDITHIDAEIVCYRDTQKNILIGKNGRNIKRLSTKSRLKIEEFIQDKVYLDLRIKVRPKWREKENFLREYGY